MKKLLIFFYHTASLKQPTNEGTSLIPYVYMYIFFILKQDLCSDTSVFMKYIRYILTGFKGCGYFAV